MGRKVTERFLKKHFKVAPNGDCLDLVYGRGINHVTIRKDFLLDEEIATLAGLMPDGSLIKDLRRIYFYQKKDISKIHLFADVIQRRFGIENKIFIRQKDKHGTFDAYVNSVTLARFFYHVLGISKSNEEVRVPRWVFFGSKPVKITYLRSVFDMEATVLKSLREIRLITKDFKFARDLQKLLGGMGIVSTVNTRIGGTHRTTQYRLSIYGKENFVEYKAIGFTIPFLSTRFDSLLRKYQISGEYIPYTT